MIKHPRAVALSWLSSAGLPSETLYQVLDSEPDPVQLMIRFRENGHIFDNHLPDSVIEILQKNSQSNYLTKCDDLVENHQIKAMTFQEPGFPSRLFSIPDAPAVLFYSGNIDAFQLPSTSIVGSRNATYAGMEATRKIAEELSRNGITIVSGLAYGIDAAAHQGCLRGKSPTVAVLGCGIDQDYPQENAALRKEILRRDGILISEYPPGEKPLGWHFPYRNRIISGLGDCLVLMQAKIRSGSMTSVQHALNQGKDVFVYPGEPGNPKYEGNHQLLREGAIYFTTAKDLMEDMGWLDNCQDVGQNDVRTAEHDVKYSSAEKKVLNQLDRGELSFDQLCDKTGFSADLLGATLSMLQIRGCIRPLPGKIYQRVTED